jgi:hypothetical protein
MVKPVVRRQGPHQQALQSKELCLMEGGKTCSSVQQTDRGYQ